MNKQVWSNQLNFKNTLIIRIKQKIFSIFWVIHGCWRSVVSGLVRWYARDMQSSDRTLVHKDAGHSWLFKMWSSYASTLER